MESFGVGAAQTAAHLGHPTTGIPLPPVKIGGLSGIKIASISASMAGGHVLAIDDNGNAWAWGSNYSGQLGNGDNDGYNATPSRVKGPGGVGYLSDVVQMAAGDDFSVAVLNNGSVWAWGDNYDKALGNTAVNGPVREPVSGAGDGGGGHG